MPQHNTTQHGGNSEHGAQDKKAGNGESAHKGGAEGTSHSSSHSSGASGESGHGKNDHAGNKGGR